MAGEYIRILVDYIKKNLSKGYALETLRWALINQGYSRVEIQKAIDIATKELAETAPKIKEKPVIKYEAMDENNQPIHFKAKRPFWKRLFGLD